MEKNRQLGDLFDEIADRLLLQGESWFKIAAYRRVATTLRDLAEPVELIAARGRLDDLPGVGDAISTKIEDYLTSGHIPILDRLRAEQPLGLRALMLETGLSARRVRMLAASSLAIDSPDRLRRALADGSLVASSLLDSAGIRTVRSWARQDPHSSAAMRRDS